MKVPNKEEIAKAKQFLASKVIHSLDTKKRTNQVNEWLAEYATAHTSAAMEGLIQWMEGMLYYEKINNGQFRMLEVCIAKAKELSNNLK